MISTEQINVLSAAGKRALLAQLLKEKAAKPKRSPLSYAQQRLWFLEQMTPGSDAYNIPSAMRLRGELDIPALTRGLNEIIRRHEALRTSFEVVAGEPMQVIVRAAAVTIPVVEVVGADASEREVELQRLIDEESTRPFDLSRGPLLRAKLLQVEEQEHVLLLTLHHIISDGWSKGLLLSELATLYEAYASGQESPLCPLSIQYADYARWQREWLQGEVLERQLAYWKEQLTGAPAVLELPIDRPLPIERTNRGGYRAFSISKETAKGLNELSRNNGATLFMTLLATFQSLLFHYSGQDDIVVGTPIAGRNRDETENLIGFFINTLVLRTDMSGDPTFVEVLRRAKEVSLGAYAHQDVPFERLVEELQPERSLSVSPLFQVMLVLQNAPSTELQLAGLSVETIRAEIESAKLDLSLLLTETEHGLEGWLEYNRDLFSSATIERMIGHFETLVQSVLSNPEQPLSELQLLRPVEREQLLVGMNRTEVAYEKGKYLAQLFEDQAERTPEAIALVYEDQQVTYGELNRRANQLAWHLRGLGVGPDEVVGLCIERSPEMVLGLMGILKAGGAYLPLDPAYPQQRLAYMLADTKAKVLLTQERLLEGLPEHEAEVICLDADWEIFTAHDEENPMVAVESENLAYVIYTSGSTGMPKGVMVSQGAICNHMRWMQERFPLTAEDAVFQKTPFSFDASVWEFYAPLFAGGRLVLAQPGGHQDSAYLVKTIAESEVTILQLVPSMLQVLVTEPRLEQCVTLRRVFCGGEVLSSGLAASLHARLENVEIHNLYGPTEAAIDATSWQWVESGRSDGTGVPIGKPIANTSVYLLDQSMKPVPLGVSGELYIGGAGLARGYRGRSELTAERFVPDPFSSDAGARLYRTGDVARYGAEGALEYVGRVDQQVKVRGFRIELGEIEAALLDREQVREAAVVVREDGEAQQLVAYLVCEGAIATSELRAQLQGRLPEYMVPSVFVTLEQMPLTPSGKIDRRALPAPASTRPELESVFKGARTPIEQRLAQIWGDVLRLAEVGVEDNFFELGGHSLLVMQVIARVRQAFQIEIPLRSLFECPTVARLAQRVEAVLSTGQNLPAPAIVAVGREKNLPLSFAQQRMWFLNQLEPEVAVYNIPAAVRLTGNLNIDALERSFSEVVRRHEALRTTFADHDGIPHQVINEAQPVEMAVIDLSAFAEEERETEAQRLIREEAQRPFDLASGPVLRLGLLRLGAEEHVLLLTLHHIVSDAWSMEVLVREISALYRAYVEGNKSPLPELAVQYADYATWQREWLQGDVLEAQLYYWRRQLADIPEVLELPTAGPRPAVQTYRAAGHPLLLSQQQTEAFKALSQAEGTTLFITLLATFQTLLWRYTGQRQVSVGTPAAGRDRVEIEGLIGCFINTLVMATDFSGKPTFREVLRRAKEVALGAYAHGDVPFERLVEELQPERSLSHSPLFQVMFVLENGSSQALQLAGVSGEKIAGEIKTAKFDLMLTLSETEQGLKGWLEYNQDLFASATIERMIGHFEVLVESVLSNPEQRLSELEILRPAEREQLLGMNRTEVEIEKGKYLAELFEEQSERTPESIAVVCEGERMTYGDLNRRANQLAWHLRSLGVGPGDIVAVCVERSPEMILGLVGVVKSGATYLPLDPAYPQQRLEYMLSNTKAKVLLTQERLVKGLPEHDAEVICLDADWETLANHSEANPRVELHEKNLVYLIYTSGSTGRPKAAAVTQESVANLMLWYVEGFGITAADRFLMITSFSFDLTQKTIFGSLLAGAQLHLNDRGFFDAQAIAELMEREKITLLNCTPSAFYQVVDSSESRQWAQLATLRRVSLGGEVINLERLRQWQQVSDAEVVNTYGPTECTDISSSYRLSRAEVQAGGVVPVGSGVWNITLYLLDAELKMVPVGVKGEVYIGGAGVGQGYVGEPAMTAERFVPDPFSKEPGARFYRVGDVGRYREDGEIEYLGRVDNQVKVRGFRIELGEIEAVLLSREQVKEAVVMARRDGPGDHQLVAYLVCDAEAAASTSSEWREYLGQRLPDYMVPAVFVMLEQMPLTPSGKVDRRALPAPASTRPELESEFKGARTPVEQRIAQIWGDVLRLAEVGVEDNFFELGGHSLLVMQVIARVRQAFQIEIPLRSLFECPTVARLAQRVEAVLSTGQNLPAPPIVAVGREKNLPLSFAQQRMWFLNQLEPDVAVYNIPAAVRLTGNLNIEALERSFSEVVRRHEALRTTFAAQDGIPHQVINEARPVVVAVTDLSAFAEEEEREIEAQRLIREEAQRPFDLARGPMLRLSLLQLGAEEYVLLLTLHHIVSDAWSIEVLVKEISVLYRAYVEGQESPLPELAVQYADYATWQREWLQGDVLEAQLYYWRRQLADIPEVLELPTAGPRPAVQTYRAAGHPLFLNQQQTEAFKALSQAEGTTLFITLLATFQTLLWRYTGQQHVSVGTPTAGRDRVEVEGLIGCFINTLVMATDFSGKPTFREVLRRVNEVALGAYAHGDVPFERLVEELQPARDLRWTPLFQAMFMLNTAREAREGVELPGLRLSPIGGSGGVAKFDVAMALDENAEGELRGGLAYNADLFEQPLMQRMTEHFGILLDAVIAKPDARLSELQLLSAAEREQVLVEWNETGREYPREICLHELFEKQVELTPNAIAVIYGEEQISYAELNERANQLARHLRGLGVGAETLVGISMERSVELMVGLLGILKSGGAYVPFDPLYPKDRFASLLQNAKVEILLTQQALLAGLPLQGIRVVRVDADWDAISKCDKENLSSLATPQSLACMIYTSGSSGEPKGVLTPHSSLVNYIDAAKVEFGLTPGERVLQFAPVTFDAASEEIYACLTSGATLVLRNELMVSTVPAFLQACRDLEIAVLDLPTAYWHHLTDAVSMNRLTLPDSLRLVIIGGERALPGRLAKWHELADQRVRLVNTYGPTEATIVSTKCDLSAPADESEVWREVPIGRPVANAQVYLLDRNLQPVPLGVTGELYIGGDGLARGYFQRPDATAAKFVPDQFSATPGARLYRSGDLARYLADGRIEFVGRNDHQVKVRGFRIETGEIESILLRQPGVREAIVIAREDVPGDKRLVAYVEVVQEAGPSISELRKALHEKLPEYMMPAAFVLLESLPLTSSGKIDRRALPAPEQGTPGNGEPYVAPSTPIQQRLAAIWAEILKQERIGIHDNFFALGGHSLLATQMVLRVRDAFQIELPLRRLFESPTVAGLAQEIERSQDSGVVFEKQAIASLPRDHYRMKRSALLAQRKAHSDAAQTDEATIAAPDEDVFVFPASFAQQRLWFLDQLKSNTAIYNIPDAVRLSGKLDTAALEQTINEITRRHEALRTTFATVDEQPVQVISVPRPDALLIHDISDLPQAEREQEALRLVKEEAQRPFNLSEGPLLRVSLLKLAEDDHVLLMTMHHIVSDGWSIGVLIREMTTLYAAFSTGQPSPLPELPIQYPDYALAQREWLSSEVLDEQLAYWKQQLSGIPAVLELPTDHPRGPIQTFRGSSQVVMLSRSLSEELDALTLKEGATLFMTLLAAFQTLLYRYTGQDGIAVGTPIAGRTSAETERLIGFFINTLVLSARMRSDLSFRELMSQVKEMALGAYAHQDVPFERLVEELQLRRDLSRSPLFQVTMVLHNALAGARQLSSDLKMGSMGGGESTVSKFDMTLSLAGTAEGLKALVEYNADLFETATIQRLLGHFEVLLEGIAADPDQHISQLPLLTAPERQQLLVDWNQTAAEYPNHKCIQQLFEEQAARTPEATAVVCGEQRLSYAELNRRANQLAHYLRSQGVGSDVLVGVCMERSIEMVVAVLSILKAGGAYLPLDPSYPQARLSFMLEDAAVPVLLTQARLAENLPQTTASVMRVDADWELALALSTENPVSDARPENLAYVIYTSGSTGQPKGVEVQHDGLINLVTWHQREYNVTSADRATQLAGPSFDAAVWELWPYLTAGAGIHIPDQETRVSPAKLLSWMASDSITIAFMPTPLAEAVLVTLEEQSPAGFTLKNLLTGGDQLQRWPHTSLPLILTNHYGPTENTVVTTSFRVAARESAHGPAMPSIGRPIANTEVYILDEHKQPVPIGVAGELHIGGDGLARGYLNRPDLSADRFIPDPFSLTPGARLYKTGDLASYLADGNIEFRGRIDHQVKIRGFRIELGEIEAALAEHSSVRESVVEAREDERGEKRLVAYIVGEQGQTVEVSELRGYLIERLPDYMVPAAFVMLDELPLTPNGKIDRRALQAQDETALTQHRTYVAPRDSVELQLVQIWENLLGTQPIGVTDNFFELGGHSLNAVRLMNRLEDRFQRELPLAILFQRATIEQLAEVLRQQQDTSAQSSMVQIRRGTAKPLFCIHPIGGTVLSYHKLAHLLNPDQAVYGFQSRGLYAEEKPHNRIEEMAADYIKELRVVQPEGPYLLAGHSMGGVIAFEMSQQLQQQGQEVALLALLDSWAPEYIPEPDDESLLVQFAQELGVPLTTAELLQVDPDERLTYFVEQAHRANALPPGMGVEQGRRYLHVYKNNHAAIRTYSPQLNQCRITLFRATEHLAGMIHEDPAAGWIGLTVPELTIYDVPGRHSTMIHEPNVRILAERLQNCINQTSTE